MILISLSINTSSGAKRKPFFLSAGRKYLTGVLSSVFGLLPPLLLLSTSSALALVHSGTIPQEFTLKDIAGNSISLSQHLSKKAVVIIFWSTWSENSPRALKRFEEFHEKYKDKGIQLIGINAENQTISADDMATINKTIKELKITFPVLIDRGLKVFHDYNVIALPSTVIITEGKISYELPGLPLVGTEEMLDYLRVLAGDQPRTLTKPGYSPRYDAVADVNLAIQLEKRGKFDAANSFYEKAIEKDTKYLLPYFKLAGMYEKENDFEKMEAILRKVLGADPGSIAVISSLSYCLVKEGRFKEGFDLLEKVAKKDASYTPAQYYYAYASGKNGRLKEALVSFEKALSLNPYNPVIYLPQGGNL